ncbi:MAG: universal stress protein [Verrucomicrobia bacterium]|nr:universal stress protein [Verrucomicrobiota bacterium]
MSTTSVDACSEVDPARLALKLKRILVPIDFSKASVRALQYAVPLAEQFGATICLVHVVEQASFANDLENLPLAIPEARMTEIARDRLISLSKKAIKRLIPVLPHVRVGKAFLEIATLASTQDIDLIVIATRGHTGLKHVLLGSTAEKVVCHAPCPVLVVREPEHEFS